MMKKMISFILTLALAISMAACNTNGADIADDNIINSADTTSSIANADTSAIVAVAEDKSISSDNNYTPSKEYDNIFLQHEPYGMGIGAMPGRVVWAHDPDSVEWDGSGYWWETEHFDETVIMKMVNEFRRIIFPSLRNIS